MLFREIHIRRWNVMFFFSFDTFDEERILDALVWADAPGSIISKVSENIRAEHLNEGFCYSNPLERKSVLGIGKTTNGPEYMDTTVHEIVHVAQHIAQTDGIDPLSEDFAYLCGDLSETVSDIICKLSCPRCGAH
jgi:hypothetical protein